VTGEVKGRDVALGNAALMEELGFDTGEFAARATADGAGAQKSEVNRAEL
jgi:hypothetical protein